MMRSLFIDCNDQLAPVWQRLVRAADPPIDIYRETFVPADLPRLLASYDICIDDHSYLPTDLIERCARLKHIVFLGTGAASYMNVGELAQRSIRVHIIGDYDDTAVAEHTIALMLACCRNIARMDREVRSGTWSTREGLQVFGNWIGRHRPRGTSHRSRAGYAGDFVISLHLALNDDTRGFPWRSTAAPAVSYRAIVTDGRAIDPRWGGTSLPGSGFSPR
jgi:hypothetical protein